MPKFYFTNVLTTNIVFKSNQFPVRSTNCIQYSGDHNLNYFFIDQNENSMYKAQTNCKVTIMGVFNFLRRLILIRNTFFLLFCLFGSTGAFAQIIIPPPIPIIKAPSTTTITSSVNPSLAGQPVLLTATITGSAQPTGTVHFYDNATNTDLTPAGVAISNGKATFTTAVLTVNASFIATYSGDGGNLPSTSAAFTQTVNPPVIIIHIDPAFYPTTTTLVSNSNPSVAGSEPVTFTATVSSSGNVNLTGIVDFFG